MLVGCLICDLGYHEVNNLRELGVTGGGGPVAALCSDVLVSLHLSSRSSGQSDQFVL